MALKQPVHGGSAQSKEIDVDLVAEGIRGYTGPYHALAVVSIGANSTLRMEISAANELDWQLDARIAGGSVEVSRIFCEGDSVRGDASEDVLEKHYDKAGNRERARRRQEHIPEDI